MSRRQVVLLTSPHDIPTSALFRALSQERKAHPLPFQRVAHSWRKTPGMASRALLNLQACKPSSSQTPNSFRHNTYSQSPHFNRNQPKWPARHPFKCSTYRLRVCKPFVRNTYKKAGEGSVMLTNSTSRQKPIAAVTKHGPQTPPALLLTPLSLLWFTYSARGFPPLSQGKP
jgi:hypothetical protein